MCASVRVRVCEQAFSFSCLRVALTAPCVSSLVCLCVCVCVCLCLSTCLCIPVRLCVYTRVQEQFVAESEEERLRVTVSLILRYITFPIRGEPVSVLLLLLVQAVLH